MAKVSKRRSKKSGLPVKLLAAIAVVIIAGGLFLIFRHHKVTSPSSTPQTLTANSAVSPATSAPPTPSKTNSTPTSNPNVPGGLTGSNVGPQPVLTAPTGNFVSNHGSTASGYPVNTGTTESSSCTTTPGASCNIQFSNSNGTVRSLGTKLTNTNSSKNGAAGTVSWTWTPQQVGLTAGSWQIEAIASLNGQTKTATDPEPLTVSP